MTSGPMSHICLPGGPVAPKLAASSPVWTNFPHPVPPWASPSQQTASLSDSFLTSCLKPTQSMSSRMAFSYMGSLSFHDRSPWLCIPGVHPGWCP